MELQKYQNLWGLMLNGSLIKSLHGPETIGSDLGGAQIDIVQKIVKIVKNAGF